MWLRNISSCRSVHTVIPGLAALRAARLGGRVVLVIGAGLVTIRPSETAVARTVPTVTAICARGDLRRR
jgi:hypothetical protein